MTRVARPALLRRRDLVAGAQVLPDRFVLLTRIAAEDGFVRRLAVGVAELRHLGAGQVVLWVANPAGEEVVAHTIVDVREVDRRRFERRQCRLIADTVARDAAESGAAGERSADVSQLLIDRWLGRFRGREAV